MAAFYDDNADTHHSEPAGQHDACSRERAAAYDAKAVSWPTRTATPSPTDQPPGSLRRAATCRTGKQLQRELLQHCKDEYLEQMRGTTDTEFLYVLLLSLLESDSNEDVQRAFEEMLRLIVQAMKDLDLEALVKLKMALVSPNRIIGVNCRRRAPWRARSRWGLAGAAGVRPGSRPLCALDAPRADVSDDGPQLPPRRESPTSSRSARLRTRPPVIFASEPLTEELRRLVQPGVRRDRVPREGRRGHHQDRQQAEGVGA